MSDDKVTISANGSDVTVPLNDDSVEVDSEWLGSLFAGLKAQAESTAAELARIGQEQTSQREILSGLQARLPENLTGLIESQQATITALVRDGQETLRSMLIPPPAPPPEIPAPEAEIVEIEKPVPESSPGPAPAKRRRI